MVGKGGWFRKRLDPSLGAGVQVDGWRGGKGISVGGNGEHGLGPVELARGRDANLGRLHWSHFLSLSHQLSL